MGPGTALILFALLLLATALVLRPRRGIAALLLRGRRANLRIEMEDALKHLYKAEYRGAEGTPESLAGALQIGQAHASRVITDLKRAGLVHEGSTARLTEEGRAYALRVIRTHRLWERYLADRTGVAPGEWHTQAEEREHFLSEADVEQLSARLGHPRYDPHGDPIPTASGELPAAVGVPLTHLEPGDCARIVHLEDEPREHYDRLVALGLSPRMTVRVLEGPSGAVDIEVGGTSVRLEDGAAQNVTVTPVPETEISTGRRRSLADLRPGETGRVMSLSPACQGIQRRRLLDLGVVPGTEIHVELSAMGGDPRAFMIRGALVALRREQQKWIRVEEDAVEGVA